MTRGWSLRALALLAATLALGGCNLVVSERPVFTAADAVGAPSLRAGVWSASQPDCDFKASDPVADWPKCAGGGVITPTAIMASVDPNSPGSPDQPPATIAKPQMTIPYVLAAGDPRVMKINVMLPPGAGSLSALFYFAALKPVARDADGRIVQAELWPIQCGPPPPPKAASAGADADQSGVTDHPLPGLKAADGMCTPTDKAAVQNAAKASRAWAGQTGTLRWVRDGMK
jgi:hypothetical protein